LAVHPAV